jgi:uncharacterized RDD family membrane protein YckC
MRKDPPVSAQLPEWKREVAEKVKAYGERKKRLTTPPEPIKETIEPQIVQEQVVQNPEPPLRETSVYVDPRPEVKEVVFQPIEAVAPSTFEVWTEDLEGLPGVEGTNAEEEQTGHSAAPYLFRRIAAGLIDHALLLIMLVIVLFPFSFVLGESMEWLFLDTWKATLGLYLLMHFLYHLYFFRSSRQTPGMLFVSLELRDPGGQTIAVGKIAVRWLICIFLNVFNFLPPLFGKRYLLHDHISNTEMRSFS